ncbi:MAG: thioesterase family protein [Methanobrevibacter sp.]|uniref:acyl-CoA thioesterase n=1 Tax=Methanobrevibacter sp. TaxID=66852 RepID=UPI002E7674B3|nr:thioesterase family protein [Methanobrevibacter sp.]MEE0924849.1 thioesterase family protein [Methanobrevibacter sp.]MEE0935577.1 thioesterase family protein [Methanobrevibacter sp.]
MFKTKVTPSFGDIDGMKHVNNNRILEWFELGGLDIYRYFTPDLNLDFENWKLIMVRKEADFVGQLRFGEDVEIRTYLLKIGNSSFTVGNEVWQSNELKAKGKTVIVHFDYVTQKSVPIPDDVRKKLEEHLISEEDIGKDI